MHAERPIDDDPAAHVRRLEAELAALRIEHAARGALLDATRRDRDAARADLAKWERPSDDARLRDAEEQAATAPSSTAAQAVFVSALRHRVAHLEQALAVAVAERDRYKPLTVSLHKQRAADVAGIVALLRRMEDDAAGRPGAMPDSAATALGDAADAIERGEWSPAPLPPDPRDEEIAGLRAAAREAWRLGYLTGHDDTVESRVNLAPEEKWDEDEQLREDVFGEVNDA